MNRKSLSLLVLAIVPVVWSTADPLVVGDAPRYLLGGHLEVLRDATRGLSLSQVMDPSAGWQRTNDSQPNIGFTSAFYWVRFQVESETDHTLLLVYRYAKVDFVDVFVVHPDGTREQMVSGSYIPFRERPVASRYPVFPLTLARGQTAWCYVRVRNDDVVFPLSVLSDSAFRNADHDEQIVIGLVLGLFAVVVLFNASYYAATRDRAYLYYVLFVLSYALFELGIRDIGGEYLWPRMTWIDDGVQVSAGSFCISMGIVFARSFLQTRTWAPVMDRVLRALVVIGAVNTVCTFVVPFRIMTQVSNVFLLVSAAALFLNALMVLRRGYRPARFYLAAWVLLLPGGVVFALFNVGFMPVSLYTLNALSLGATMEVVLLFLAIVDRILLMRREGERLQEDRLEAMEKRLYADTLTEFPNRNRLIRDLVSERPVTIALVNIDDFKEINDLFGQRAGDFVIRETGNRVRAAVADRGGAVYRLHADEFAVVIGTTCAEEQLNDLGVSLTACCRDVPYLYENETLRLDVSVGIAVTDTRHLEKADMALSVARARKTFIIYRPELEVIKRYADNLHWLHVIREAVEREQIVPFFQPIMNNASGTIDKFEALMRIRAADGKIILPGAFFTIAKKSKMYPQLSRAIIEKTTRMMRETGREVSINVSLEDIIHPAVLETIDRVVSERDIGRRVVFELLESEGIENYAEVSRFIERMKSRGCKIAIDDFGAGYSNFEHILRLRVDYLKLDASLIKPIASDANARSIVETIVSFARKLGIQTIAEFVHNKDVQDVVRSIGVDHSQGYFISEPLPDMTFVLPVSHA